MMINKNDVNKNDGYVNKNKSNTMGMINEWKKEVQVRMQYSTVQQFSPIDFLSLKQQICRTRVFSLSLGMTKYSLGKNITFLLLS